MAAQHVTAVSASSTSRHVIGRQSKDSVSLRFTGTISSGVPDVRRPSDSLYELCQRVEDIFTGLPVCPASGKTLNREGRPSAFAILRGQEDTEPLGAVSGSAFTGSVLAACPAAACSGAPRLG